MCTQAQVCVYVCVCKRVFAKGGQVEGNHGNRGGKEFQEENRIFTYCLQKITLPRLK